MNSGNDQARIRRLKYWLVALTLLPGGALMAAGFPKASLGFLAGSAAVFLNFLGTERAVLAFVGKSARVRILVLVFFAAKLGLTAGMIVAVLKFDVVSPVALVAGFSTLFVALVFDFLFFKRNIGGEEES